MTVDNSRPESACSFELECKFGTNFFHRIGYVPANYERSAKNPNFLSEIAKKYSE
jgi:hypothetical protein